MQINVGRLLVSPGVQKQHGHCQWELYEGCCQGQGAHQGAFQPNCGLLRARAPEGEEGTPVSDRRADSCQQPEVQQRSRGHQALDLARASNGQGACVRDRLENGGEVVDSIGCVVPDSEVDQVHQVQEDEQRVECDLCHDRVAPGDGPVPAAGQGEELERRQQHQHGQGNHDEHGVLEADGQVWVQGLPAELSGPQWVRAERSRRLGIEERSVGG